LRTRPRATTMATVSRGGAAGDAGASRGVERRTLAVACGAHVLHDGYADTLYLLLPLWKAEFLLGYAAVAALRALYSGCMAVFQTPSSLLAERMGGRWLLALGTALAALGYLVASASSAFATLAAALIVGGLGASVQHPISSSLVARAFQGSRSRSRLATYNFSGDLGKMALPALTAGLLAFLSWRAAMAVLGVCGLLAACAVLLLPRGGRPAADERRAPPANDPSPAPIEGGPRPFRVLLAIGVLDSATRMGFLTFLPFLLRAKGATLPVVGAALALVFLGGACGKLVCGFLGARLGVVTTVILTEGLTAAGIVALLPLRLPLVLALLPPVGLALNGTSSVLYGTVPELVAPDRQARAFSLFYTGTIGAGALSPVAYGMVSDLAGVPLMMSAVAAVVLLTLPLAWALRPALAHGPG
jgi:MFS transporter, FSR family, fosmidomycin resistance protein